MSSKKNGNMTSLVEYRRKQAKNKQKMCPCRIRAISLGVILLAVFLQGACVVLGELWWRSLGLILVATAIEVVVVFVGVITVAVVDAKPHNSDCLSGDQE